MLYAAISVLYTLTAHSSCLSMAQRSSWCFAAMDFAQPSIVLKDVARGASGMEQERGKFSVAVGAVG